jgi:hypothetical protein
MAISGNVEVLNVQILLAWRELTSREISPIRQDLKRPYVPALSHHVFAILFYFC